MMSPPIDISASCKMPSLLTSTTDKRLASTVLQRAIHSGKLANGVLTSTVYTSYLANTARAGAVK